MAGVKSDTDRRLKWLGNFFLLIFIVWTLVPFYWMLVTSLKKHKEIYGTEATLWPQDPTLESYYTLFFETDYFLFFKNSMLVALSTTFMTVLCASLAAYAIARLDFPGRKILARGMIYTYLVPQSLLFIPPVRDHGRRRAYQQPDRPDARPSGLHHPVLHLAADGLFHLDPERARRRRFGGRLHAPRGLVSDYSADLAAGTRGHRLLLVHAFLERISVRDRFQFYAVCTDHSDRPFPISWSRMSFSGGRSWRSTIFTVIPPLIVYFFFQRWLITGLTMGAVKA